MGNIETRHRGWPFLESKRFCQILNLSIHWNPVCWWWPCSCSMWSLPLRLRFVSGTHQWRQDMGYGLSLKYLIKHCHLILFETSTKFSTSYIISLKIIFYDIKEHKYCNFKVNQGAILGKLNNLLKKIHSLKEVRYGIGSLGILTSNTFWYDVIFCLITVPYTVH